MEPEPSSLPLRSMSKHAPFLKLSYGSTNGWWNASFFPETGSTSNMGQSTSQWNWNVPSGTRPRSAASCLLMSPAPSSVLFHGPAIRNMRSPSSAFIVSLMPFLLSSVKYLTMLLSNSPLTTLIHVSPPSPNFFANAMYLSTSFLPILSPAISFLRFIPTMMPPSATIFFMMP